VDEVSPANTNLNRPIFSAAFFSGAFGMVVQFVNRFACLAFVAAVVVGQFAASQSLLAQSTAKDKQSVKIQPYTGKPIFLDEPEQIAKPQMVRTEKIVEKFDDETTRVERDIAVYSDNHFEAEGSYREFYPNGKVFVEGQFKNGRQNGEWTFYFDNGKLNRKATYKDGKPDGPREIFRADGTLTAKRGFTNGLRDGDWITYDDTGKKPIAEEHWDNGKEDGTWKYWHPNGKLRQEIGLKQGKRHGVSTEWDDKGEKRFEATFVDGKLHGTATRWYPGGRRIVQKYEEGKLVSQSS
jgi:antitoxin component YwqK of YwqJK toxin-antitoxin module